MLFTGLCVYIDCVSHVSVMSSRWPKDNSKLNKFREIATQMSITIYGSYQPDSEMRLLERQRDALRLAGYPMTSLVSDYALPRERVTNLETSMNSLERSDVNFLIFTRNGTNLGVTDEVAHVTTSHSMSDRAHRCVVFDEVLDDRGTASTLSVERIKNSGIIRREFCGEDDLRQMLMTCAHQQVRMQYHTLLDRL